MVHEPGPHGVLPVAEFPAGSRVSPLCRSVRRRCATAIYSRTVVGRDILAQQQQEIRRAKQLELPAVAGPRIPILYIQIDGTGVPVTIAEAQGRQGKQPGQPAHTREAKLGCVFTQTGTDAEGRPVRDENSTSYVGAIETAEEFGLRI